MTSPFATAPVAYSGLGQPRDRRYNPAARRFWLGKPGQMVQIPSPQIGYSAKPTQGEAVSTNGSGGTSVRRRNGIKWQWDFSYSKLIGADLELILGFYMRTVVGSGPWCFLPPEFTNLLTLAQSLAGNLNGVAEGWSTLGADVVAYDGTATPGVLPSGVLHWTSAGLSSRLVAGNAPGGTLTADPTSSVPYIAAEPFTGSMWVQRAASAASARARLIGLAANGTTVVGTVTGSTVTLSATVPQLLTVTAAPNALTTAAYIVLELQSQTGSGTLPEFYLSSPQLRRGSTPGDWGQGRGAPRVVWPAGPDSTIDGLYGSNPTMTLAQA
jgi:hypothetical protein